MIFAQSGSGKSFFVGRLIEEIFLHTSPRVLIIDPNSDYSHIDHVNPSAFETTGYNAIEGTGFLPTDDDYAAFCEIWKHLNLVKLRPVDMPLNFIDPDIFLSRSAEVSPLRIRCAFSYLKLIDDYLRENWAACRTKADGAKKEYDIDGLIKMLRMALKSLKDENNFESLFGGPYFGDKMTSEEIRSVRERTQQTQSDVAFLDPLMDSETLGSLLFKVKEASDFLAVSASKPPDIFRNSGLYILDKPSLPRDYEYTIIKYYLDIIWAMHEESYKNGAIDRPTFIFIDEAHNLIPKDTGGQTHIELLRDVLRRIAAEGRKYGVYLFIISQRPDKLDPLVVSECQNKIIMRVGSLRALQEASITLGLTTNQVDEMKQAVDFKMGRAFVIGPMADQSTLTPSSGSGAIKMYAAARRTTEGGRKLPPEWRSSGLEN